MSDGENVRAVLAALAGGWQDLEDAAQATIVGRTLDGSVGAQMDALGKLVGEPRNGLDDEPYRRRLRARIATNRSSGLCEQAIRIARLVLGASYDAPASRVIVDRAGNAQYTLRVDGASVAHDVADDVARFLVVASGSAIRPIVESSELAPATWARFDLDSFDNGRTMISARDHVHGDGA